MNSRRMSLGATRWIKQMSKLPRAIRKARLGVRRLALACMLVALPGFAVAGGWTEVGYIKRLWSQPNGGDNEIFSIEMTTPAWNPDSCEGGNWYRLTADSFGYKTAVSLLMSAQAQGKRVRVYLDGCTQSYPRIVNVMLYD